MRKFRSGHLVYISQWLKLGGVGGGEAAFRLWNDNFLISKGRTERVGKQDHYGLPAINNARSEDRSRAGIKAAAKLVAASYKSFIMMKMLGKSPHYMLWFSMYVTLRI
jgi:hypothetical protein